MAQNLSPKVWIRFWYGGFMLGLVILIFGISQGDALMIFLGVVLMVLTPAMIAFWRSVEARDQPPNSN
jgi:lipid-A-disaccharide synthase-like uncharacterized protein